METRIVTYSEMRPCGRLDAHHYLPEHRVWEHYTRKSRPTHNDIIEAWLHKELPDEDFLKAVSCRV